MPDLLVILSPRKIAECLAAFDELDIDKLWVKNMNEATIAEQWPRILRYGEDYERLIVSSDDGIPRPHALAEVQRLLDDGHPVVTGYSNLSVADMRVNLAKQRYRDFPSELTHDFYNLAEVMESESETIPTLLVGFALTGMPLELWQRFPFAVYSDWPGNASDFCLSLRLEQAEIPMVAARDAFVWHVKQVWNHGDTDPRKRLYLNEPSDLVLEQRVAA